MAIIGPTARKVEAPAGKAMYSEVSDDYIKARFTCCACGSEERRSLGDIIKFGIPGCIICHKSEDAMTYTGAFHFN